MASPLSRTPHSESTERPLGLPKLPQRSWRILLAAILCVSALVWSLPPYRATPASARPASKAPSSVLVSLTERSAADQQQVQSGVSPCIPATNVASPTPTATVTPTPTGTARPAPTATITPTVNPLTPTATPTPSGLQTDCLASASPRLA